MREPHYGVEFDHNNVGHLHGAEENTGRLNAVIGHVDLYFADHPCSSSGNRNELCTQANRLGYAGNGKFPGCLDRVAAVHQGVFECPVFNLGEFFIFLCLSEMLVHHRVSAINCRHRSCNNNALHADGKPGGHRIT